MALDQQILERWRETDLVVLGGSAGSFKLFFSIIKAIDPDINKTVVIVMHRKKNFFSEIENLFAEHSRIYLKEITDKDIIKPNTIYLAPANYHTLFESEGYFSLDVSEAVWYSKPSIDVTFESAADIYGKRCAAILLSGANQDGAEGMLKLRQSGALTIAQDPQEAEMPEMPAAAIKMNAAECVLTIDEMLRLFKT